MVQTLMMLHKILAHHRVRFQHVVNMGHIPQSGSKAPDCCQNGKIRRIISIQHLYLIPFGQMKDQHDRTQIGQNPHHNHQRMFFQIPSAQHKTTGKNVICRKYFLILFSDGGLAIGEQKKLKILIIPQIISHHTFCPAKNIGAYQDQNLFTILFRHRHPRSVCPAYTMGGHPGYS